MKMYLILASVAAVAVATPTLAQPSHAGHGKGNAPRARSTATSHAAPRDVGRYGTWGNSCPPGLAKNNGCLPPGQARKRYRSASAGSAIRAELDLQPDPVRLARPLQP